MCIRDRGYIADRFAFGSYAEFQQELSAAAQNKFNHFRGSILGGVSDRSLVYLGPDRPNPAYFDELDRRVAEIHKRGITADLMLASDPETIDVYKRQVFGSTSSGFNYVSRMNASGDSVFGVQIAGIYLTDAIALDSFGNVLIAGYGPGGLPVTPNAYRSSPSGPIPTFACKLNGADGTPAFCTYLNSDQISITGIGADAGGNVYILAIDLMQSIVTTPGALSLGRRDVVLLKLDPTGQTLLYAAAFGGNGVEGLLNLSVDADGDAYVMGVTSSTNFPGAANGAIPTPSGSFIAKVDPTGSKILYASYGRAGENPWALNVDQSGACLLYTSVGHALERVKADAERKNDAQRERVRRPVKQRCV